MKQEKDPTATALVKWAVPTHFQREPDEGENMAITSCGQQPGVNNINADVLVMELVASQSYGDILTDTLIISNILTEGVNASGKPRIKIEQLHYLLAGALAPCEFEVTQEDLRLACEGLCVSPYIMVARPNNHRA